MQLVTSRERDSELFLERLDHVVPVPRPLEVKLVDLRAVLPFRMELQRRLAAREVLDHAFHQALREIHDIIHVRIGHVELADRELGIMRQVDPFVPEDTANLVNAVQAPYDELLEVQLGRNAEVQVEVEVVVVRDERLGRRAARDHARHGRLDLEEPEAVEVPADVVDDLVACDEDAPRVFGEYQVEVSLAVPGLLVFQPEVPGGQLVQVRCEQDHLGGRYGELAFLRARGPADDTDDVASTEYLMGGCKRIGILGVSEMHMGS